MTYKTSLVQPWIPETPGVIDRPRLLHRLANFHKHRLTLIAAPSGYGKTTLAAQFAREIDTLVIWHSVEERERDLPNLHQHSLEILEAAVPGILDSVSPAGGQSPVALATELADYLRDNLTEPLLYVLDDIHHLSGALAAETWLETLISRIPHTCHPILLSRTLPQLPFMELVSRNQVLVLNQDDLRLTDEEADYYIDQVLDDIVSAADKRQLLEPLEGWPAGTTLALRPRADTDDASALIPEASPEVLFDRLAESMVEGLSTDLQRFLHLSSTLVRLTPERCRDVLGVEDSLGLLDDVFARNLFLVRSESGYVYHALFRQFLQRQFKAQTPEQFAAAHREAARWFEDRNHLEEAFDHYVSAGAVEEALRLAGQTAVLYFNEGRVETLLHWAEALEEIGVSEPTLLYNCALIYTDRYEYEQAQRALERAEQIFRERGERIPLEEVQVQQAWIHQQVGDLTQAIGLANPLTHSEDVGVQARALRVVGLAHVYRGETQVGRDYLEEAAELHLQAGLIAARGNVLQSLVLVYTRVGELDRSEACLEEIVQIRRQLDNQEDLALALNDLGYHYHLRGLYQDALRAFEDGLRQIVGLPSPRQEGYLLWSMGDLLRDLGNTDEAGRIYDRALKSASKEDEPRQRSGVLLSLATLRRRMGQFTRALPLAEGAMTLAEATGLPVETDLAQATLWSVRAQLDDPTDALEKMDVILSRLWEQEARMELGPVLVLCAAVSLMCGREKQASAYLDQAQALSVEVGTAQPIIAEIADAPEVEQLIAEADRYEDWRNEIRRLRTARRALARQRQTDPEVQPQLTYSLNIGIMGREEVTRDGKPVSSSQWEAQGARELFYYLLLNGPQPTADLLLAFWPDGDPKNSKNLLYQTVSRARQAVGKNAITREDNRYQINPMLEIRCDALEIEMLTDRAQRVPPHNIHAQELWRKAVELYQGELLPSLGGKWLITRRENLNDRYVNALLGLANHALEQGDFNPGIDYYRRALEFRPYHEEIHRDLLRCYAGLKDRSRVQEHFDQLTQLLQDDLELEPTDETVQLVNKLLR